MINLIGSWRFAISAVWNDPTTVFAFSYLIIQFHIYVHVHVVCVIRGWMIYDRKTVGRMSISSANYGLCCTINHSVCARAVNSVLFSSILYKVFEWSRDFTIWTNATLIEFRYVRFFSFDLAIFSYSARDFHTATHTYSIDWYVG